MWEPTSINLFLTAETAEDAELFQCFEIFSARSVLNGKVGPTTPKRDTISPLVRSILPSPVPLASLIALMAL
jgi:hypothetical protein